MLCVDEPTINNVSITPQATIDPLRLLQREATLVLLHCRQGLRRLIHFCPRECTVSRTSAYTNKSRVLRRRKLKSPFYFACRSAVDAEISFRFVTFERSLNDRPARLFMYLQASDNVTQVSLQRYLGFDACGPALGTMFHVYPASDNAIHLSPWRPLGFETCWTIFRWRDFVSWCNLPGSYQRASHADYNKPHLRQRKDRDRHAGTASTV